MSSVQRTAGVAGTFPYTLSAVPTAPPTLTIYRDADRTVVAVASVALTPTANPAVFTCAYPATLGPSTYYLQFETVFTIGQPPLVDADDTLLLVAITGSTSADVLALEVVKDALGIKPADLANDSRLEGIIAASVQKVTDLCGPLTATAVLEDHQLGSAYAPVFAFGPTTIVLRVWPVVSVQSVTLYPGATAVPAVDVGAGIDGYELDLRAGTIDYPFRGAHVRVAYTAGRAVVPPTIIEALEILIDHLWRRSKNRVGVGQRAVYGGADPESSSPYPAGFAMPTAAKELLQFELKPPSGLG